MTNRIIIKNYFTIRSIKSYNHSFHTPKGIEAHIINHFIP
jgi:hypothetical protein